MVASRSQHQRRLQEGARLCTHALILAEEQSLGIGFCKAKAVSDVFHDKCWAIWLATTAATDRIPLPPAFCITAGWAGS